MEFERSFYRIHERMIKHPSCPNITNGLLIFFSTLSIYSLTVALIFSILLIYAQVELVYKSTIITETFKDSMISSQDELIKNDELIMFAFTFDQIDASFLADEYHQHKRENNVTFPYINFTTVPIFAIYMYSQNLPVLTLPNTIK